MTYSSPQSPTHGESSMSSTRKRHSFIGQMLHSARGRKLYLACYVYTYGRTEIAFLVLSTIAKEAHRLLSWAICRTCCCPGASEACRVEDLFAPLGAPRCGPNWRTLPSVGDTQVSNFSWNPLKCTLPRPPSPSSTTSASNHCGADHVRLSLRTGVRRKKPERNERMICRGFRACLPAVLSSILILSYHRSCWGHLRPSTF